MQDSVGEEEIYGVVGWGRVGFHVRHGEGRIVVR